ncbi:MAG: hypothetical protein AABZ60_10590 [Planctomycetota bacterium]
MLFLFFVSGVLGTFLLSLCGVFGFLISYLPETYALGGWTTAQGYPMNVRMLHFVTGFFAVLILTFPYILSLFWVEGARRAILKEIEKKPKWKAELPDLKQFRRTMTRISWASLCIIILGLLSGGATRRGLPIEIHFFLIGLAYLQNLYGLTRLGDRMIVYLGILEELWTKLDRV